MRKFILFSLIFSLAIAGGILAFARVSGRYAPPVPAWFKGSTANKVENLGLIQPSYADLMLWTGIRFDELYMGGSKGKWLYAKHEAKKIKETLEKAALVDPSKREGIEGLLSANYPGLTEAIDSQDADKFTAAFGRLYASCINCHLKHNVPFMPLIPTTSISPITSGSMKLWEGMLKQMQMEAQKKQ